MSQACSSSPASQPGSSVHDQAGYHYRQGRYADAERLYKESLALDEKNLGPDHPDVATTLNNLALVYKTQGRYTDAEPLYKRALTMLENKLGAENPSVATSLSNLALLSQSQGKYARSGTSTEASVSS